jgi:hypothetical protein
VVVVTREVVVAVVDPVFPDVYRMALDYLSIPGSSRSLLFYLKET